MLRTLSSRDVVGVGRAVCSLSVHSARLCLVECAYGSMLPCLAAEVPKFCVCFLQVDDVTDVHGSVQSCLRPLKADIEELANRGAEVRPLLAVVSM